MAEDQFGVTHLPKFWFRQFAELWPLGTQKIGMQQVREIFGTTVKSVNNCRYNCRYDELIMEGSVICDFGNNKLGGN